MSSKKITKRLSVDEVKEVINNSGLAFDARYVLDKVQEELPKFKDNAQAGPDSLIYKSFTLFEFEKGPLLCTSVPEKFSVFALEFCKNLQDEYKCDTPSQKSLAEVVALNFVRVLGAQTRISNYLDKDSVTDIGVNYLKAISQELDRAQRHYLISLQALRMLKLPPLQVNIKTQTAVVGQNQMVQANNQNDKAI